MDKGPVTLKEKPVIGISACGFNAPIRYNGRSMDFIKAIGREKGDFRWCPVCPETAAGLGVPRDPIHLAGPDGRSIWKGEGKIVSRNGHDVTAVMLAAAQESLATLRRAGAKVFIYMDGSPSCGVYRTTLRKQSRGKPPGVFGALLDTEGFFLIPALDMQSPLKWWDCAAACWPISGCRKSRSRPEVICMRPGTGSNSSARSSMIPGPGSRGATWLP
ncbi:MAG: DUF523 domain-containing protein [Clostridiales bacterium]|nr:DUF523 domain-containing protein [Clostridiales bacterium]